MSNNKIDGWHITLIALVVVSIVYFGWYQPNQTKNTNSTIQKVDDPTPPKNLSPVKMSNSGICHKPGSTYYSRTKNFTPYDTLKECIDAGGRLPER